MARLSTQHCSPSVPSPALICEPSLSYDVAKSRLIYICPIVHRLAREVSNFITARFQLMTRGSAGHRRSSSDAEYPVGIK